MRCPKCGCNNTEDSNFCKNCGARLDNVKRNRSTGKVKKKPAFAVENTHRNFKVIIIAYTVIVLVFCIILLSFMMVRNRLQDQIDLDDFSNPPDVVQDDTGKDSGNSGSAKSGKPEVTESGSKDVKIINSGYSITNDKYSNEQYFFYGLEYKNKGSEKTIGWADVKVTLRDKAGTVVDTYQDSTLVCLDAGETSGIAYSCGSIKGRARSVDIDFKYEDASKAFFPTEEDVCRLDIDDINIKRNDETFSIVTGDAVNNSKKDYEYGIVYIIFKNKKGEITGGNEIYLDRVQKGKNAFSYDFLDTQIVTDKYVCYGLAQN